MLSFGILEKGSNVPESPESSASDDICESGMKVSSLILIFCSRIHNYCNLTSVEQLKSVAI